MKLLVWMPMKLTKNFARNHYMHDIIFSTNTLNGWTLDGAAHVCACFVECIQMNINKRFDSNWNWINRRKLAMVNDVRLYLIWCFVSFRNFGPDANSNIYLSKKKYDLLIVYWYDNLLNNIYCCYCDYTVAVAVAVTKIQYPYKVLMSSAIHLRAYDRKDIINHTLLNLL